LDAPGIVPCLVVGLAMIVAAATDFWKFKVYNALTLPLLAGGLVYGAWDGGWSGLASSGVGALVGFGLLVGFHAMGGVGAGDVKLLAAAGAWLGATATLYVAAAGAIACGVYALGLTLATGSLGATVLALADAWQRLASLNFKPGSAVRVEDEVRRPGRRRRLIPFAAMLAVGLAATLAWSGVDLGPGGPIRTASARVR